MSDGLSVQVEGDAELSASLARVAEGLGHLEHAGQVAGQAIKQRAASAAPVNTGALSRSITATATGTEVTVGSALPYAPFQEYGTATVPASPYLRPALEASTSVVLDAYTAEVESMLEQVKGA